MQSSYWKKELVLEKDLFLIETKIKRVAEKK